MKFSVLLSIYEKEKPEYFNRAMQSIWDDQSIRPDEVVLVQDGPLSHDLYRAIDTWKQKLSNKLLIIVLEKNVGLGEALNVGLNACNSPLIARMDTDDIAYEKRFEKQLDIFENTNIDICSSWIDEFDDNEKDIKATRKVPEMHTEIIHFSKKRNPLNHPAVMYKKSSVLDAGGYKTMYLFEDYYLWIRMILHGAKFYNIQESLVDMRAGCRQLERRSGLQYAKYELKFQKELLRLEHITISQFLYNITLRFTTRVMPNSIVKKVYSMIRDKHLDR